MSNNLTTVMTLAKGKIEDYHREANVARAISQARNRNFSVVKSLPLLAYVAGISKD